MQSNPIPTPTAELRRHPRRVSTTMIRVRTSTRPDAGCGSPARGDAGCGRSWQGGGMQRFEYRVVQLRESLVGGKLSADKLEEILNDEARKGWMVKAITSAELKGRVGPGGVDGLLVTFERP